MYCSVRCHKEDQHAKYILRWKEGLETGMRGRVGISCYIRRYLKEKYDNKCCLCEWSRVNPATGKVPLEIDHINGDYTDNHEDNLRLICPNCHSLTPTYRALNRNKHTHKRK